jgi:hypothetical protein
MFVDPVPTTERPDQIRPLPVDEKLTSRRISKCEVFLAGTAALIAYTALLLRLPYRAPLVNCLFAGLALSSFYFYLKLRLRISVPLRILFCLVLSIVIDVIGNQFGLFGRRIAFIPYDISTHFVASGLSFIPVMWFLLTLIKRFRYRLPLGFIAFFSLTTTFSLAAYYEITELIDERVFGGHRIWTPRDSVQDLAADLVGIIIAAVGYTLAIRRQWQRHNSGSDEGM